MNNVTLMGNLGSDPELKTSKSDNHFATFSIATNDGYGDNKKTNWHNCIAFGKTAEIISKFCKKGDSLAVSGSIDYNKKEDSIYTNITVNNFSFGKNEKSGSGNKTEKPSEKEEDDLPF